MPIQILLVAEPEANTSPEESIEYHANFIVWLHTFFREVLENIDEIDEQTDAPLFEAEQIAYFEEALEEMEGDDHFENLHELVSAMDPRQAFVHGLYGSQARWKYFNINFSLTRFLEQRTAALFERLLSSIDALLDSILGAVPGGSAVKELKEAVRNSVALVTD
ncbi:MAG: hypothetical protein KDJ27_17515 [Gammaproteobacteria bacterium]|nr:hypothetical protein [Gammaproteobacteria bacterium]